MGLGPAVASRTRPTVSPRGLQPRGVDCEPWVSPRDRGCGACMECRHPSCLVACECHTESNTGRPSFFPVPVKEWGGLGTAPLLFITQKGIFAKIYFFPRLEPFLAFCTLPSILGARVRCSDARIYFPLSTLYGLFFIILLYQNFALLVFVSSMNAARPATRPTHAFHEFCAHSLYVLSSRLRLLDGYNPTNPFIPREWRDVLPCC